VVVETVAKQNPRDAILWRDLYDRFKLLVDKQQEVPEERRLRVYCDYTDHSGEKGAFSFFYFKPEFGKWTHSKGPDHVFWAKFEEVATLAGAKLGSPKNTASPSTWGALMGGVSPSVYWLHMLYDYLLKNASPEVSAADDKRAVIKSVCENSATFCSHLERKALETSASAPVPNQMNVEERPDNKPRQVAVQSQSAKGRRERGPDYDKISERVALEDSLRSELATIKSRAEHYTDVDQLRGEFPDFQLWKILSATEQQELLTDEFKPRAYARTLVANKYGLTNPETIKKDRQKLRNRNK
jgi:hypothetical protein